MTQLTEQDQAAFEKWYEHSVRANEKSLHKEVCWQIWQAALAYARERQAEREMQLVKWLLSKDVWKCSLTDKEARELIEAFNAQEQGL